MAVKILTQIWSHNVNLWQCFKKIILSAFTCIILLHQLVHPASWMMNLMLMIDTRFSRLIISNFLFFMADFTPISLLPIFYGKIAYNGRGKVTFISCVWKRYVNFRLNIMHLWVLGLCQRQGTLSAYFYKWKYFSLFVVIDILEKILNVIYPW